jgi:formylglycine-generating enzyme required for sulfatase activity
MKVPISQIFLLAVCAAPMHVSYAVTIDTVPIGNPGNAADLRYLDGDHPGGVGAVAYSFRIGATEITNTQYVEFLNAVAASDPYELWNEAMGIARTGIDGSYTYAVKPPEVGQGPSGGDYTYADKPVQFVSWHDAIRFTNWLHNGQGGPGSTEDGAYILLGGGPTPINWMTITRNPEARWWLPNEDEWYKTAYHKNDGVTGNYWDYPTGTNNLPNNNLPANDTGNSANFFGDQGYTTGNSSFPLTGAGAYTLSASDYGTFDQGGNVWEWTEIPYNNDRGLRGGDIERDSTFMLASVWATGDPNNKISFWGGVGFRVATIRHLPGDFNHNGIVDAADYVIWRKNPGGTYTPDDYNTWQANFGATLASGAGASGSDQAISPIVPEPATVLLLVFGAAVMSFPARQFRAELQYVNNVVRTSIIDLHGGERRRQSEDI